MEAKNKNFEKIIREAQKLQKQIDKSIKIITEKLIFSEEEKKQYIRVFYISSYKILLQKFPLLDKDPKFLKEFKEYFSKNSHKYNLRFLRIGIQI